MAGNAVMLIIGPRKGSHKFAEWHCVNLSIQDRKKPHRERVFAVANKILPRAREALFDPFRGRICCAMGPRAEAGGCDCWLPAGSGYRGTRRCRDGRNGRKGRNGRDGGIARGGDSCVTSATVAGNWPRPFHVRLTEGAYALASGRVASSNGNSRECQRTEPWIRALAR